MSKPQTVTVTLPVEDIAVDLPPQSPVVFEDWEARDDFETVDDAAAADLGWHREIEWVGRPGQGLVPYAATDPRVELDACTHGQIRDLPTGPGPVARCLDCGGLIHTAERALLDDPQPLDCAALDLLRQEWNNIQFGGL